MSGADPRQFGQFNAAWTLGYIARFAAAGAARVAVSAPVGAFGIVGEAGALPVFHVIQGCAALRGATLHAAPTTGERDVLALLAVLPDRRELWLANLTPEPLTILVPQEFRDCSVARLDASAPVWRESRLEGRTARLSAYAVSRCLIPETTAGPR